MSKLSLLSVVALLCSVSVNAQSLSSTSRGSKFNPAIGLNTLFKYTNSSKTPDEDGLALEAVELQFSSDVDAYFRAEATIGIHAKHEEEGATEHAHGYDVEPEEVFVETISLPYVTVKAGKSFVNFGKYNAVHTHAQPFISKSQLQTKLIGEESLSQVGIGASFLAPLGWFSEVSLQAFQPENDELFVDSHHSPAYSVKWKNLWELSDDLTLESGLSAIKFHAHSHGSDVEDETSLMAADLTFKWKPSTGGKYNSFMWSTEFISKERSGSVVSKNSGVTTFSRVQLSQRLFAQAQYEFIGFGKSEGENDINSYAALVAFNPTEFSSLRAQYEQTHESNTAVDKKISLQLNVSIGAHPAHQY